MRKMIAGMQISVDGKVEGYEGYADWVETWSDNYGLMPHIDACLLGSKMYAGYEEYWGAVQSHPDKPLPMTNRLPTPAELEWARFAARTPHYVLSSSLTAARWPHTRILRSIDEAAALKQRAGKSIYLVGGGRTLTSLVEAGLVDELRLHVHPLIAGDGKGLFAHAARRCPLELRDVSALGGGRVSLAYEFGR